MFIYVGIYICRCIGVSDIVPICDLWPIFM